MVDMHGHGNCCLGCLEASNMEPVTHKFLTAIAHATWLEGKPRFVYSFSSVLHMSLSQTAVDA